MKEKKKEKKKETHRKLSITNESIKHLSDTRTPNRFLIMK